MKFDMKKLREAYEEGKDGIIFSNENPTMLSRFRREVGAEKDEIIANWFGKNWVVGFQKKKIERIKAGE